MSVAGPAIPSRPHSASQPKFEFMSSPQDDGKGKSSDMLSFEHWRQKAARMTGLGLSPEDVIKRDELAKLERDEKQWKLCEKNKAELLHNSAYFAISLSTPGRCLMYVIGPAVLFMMKQLRVINCNVTAGHFQCQPCRGVSAGGFSPSYGIILCQDGFQNKKHMEDTIVHELIHMYDTSKFKVDWTNLKHQACSEVSSTLSTVTQPYLTFCFHKCRFELPISAVTAHTDANSTEALGFASPANAW
jgi:hypothetical protein